MREKVILVCTECLSRNYSVYKNNRTNVKRLELRKYCKKCGKIIDLFGEQAPKLEGEKTVEGNIIQEEQLYYKGICAKCAKKLN